MGEPEKANASGVEPITSAGNESPTTDSAKIEHDT